MKLLLVLGLLTLVFLARSAPPDLSTERTLILPDYSDEQESDENIDVVATTSTKKTTTTTLQTPMRTRLTWRIYRTSTIKTTTDSDDEPDDLDESESYLKNIRKFFKKLVEDLRKLLKNITGYDVIQAIRNFFNKSKQNNNYN